jgi:hypothetical protein
VADQDVRLLAAINAAEEDSYGSDNDSQLANDRAYSIGLYLGKNYDPVMEGRSSVIDRSVFETVEWIKPSLCRIFAGTDDIVELPPIGPDDEAAAKQETQYLNWVITQKNNWFQIFYEWCSDALMTKNAYCLAYRDNYTSTSVERYERQTEAGLTALLSDKDVEVTGQRSYPDPDYEPQPMMTQGPQGPQPVLDPATGQPAMQPPPMLYDVELRRKEERSKVCMRVLAPERCKASERTPSWRLDECDYFEHWDMKTLSDLRSEGFDVADDIPGGDDPETEEDQARDQYDETTDTDNHTDPAMRRVRARSIWIRHDYDGDGIAELQYVVCVGSQILYREEVSRIPVACIVPTPLPHRHMGLSITDITHDLQRIKTAILRQGLDNLFQSNNVRHAITNKVNLDDMLMNIPGGVVQVADGALPGNEIMPLPVPFLFPQAMEGLEYMDQIRENRTGTNRYFTGIDQNAMNKTATGIQQLSSMAAQRVEQIARVIATGVEDLFSIVHELILKAGHQKEVVKLRGQWVEVDPSTWKKRSDFKISVGYAAGNKDALMQKLLMIANFQKEAAMGGLPIVQPENFYETATELVKAADMTAPGRFFTNPSEAPPKGPPQPDVTVMAMEQIKSQTTLRAKQMDVEQKERDSQRDFQAKMEELRTKTELDLTKHREAIQHETAKVNFGAQKDEHMTRISAELNPKNIEAQAKAQESATASQVLQAMQQSQQQQTQIILSAFAELTKAMSAPREFMRDANGRPTGSRIAQQEPA